MTTTFVQSTIDAERWPDVAAEPKSRRGAWLVAKLVRRLARVAEVRIVYPDGTHVGPHGPVLRLRRPENFYRRVAERGLIGFGESYQAGDWDADDLAALLTVLGQRMDVLVPAPLQWVRRFYSPTPPQRKRGVLPQARRDIQHHYDLSNELFAAFLDSSLSYSSAIFRDPAEKLEEAQQRKIARLLDAVELRSGMQLLEIGTGWGELAIQAAARGAHVHTITLSREQHDLAGRRIAEVGLSERVTLELRDFRQLAGQGQYDAIVSVEMIEAIGEAAWPTYFQMLDRLLVRGGSIALQAITMGHEQMLAGRAEYTWIQKYIFPGGLIPSLPAIAKTVATHTDLELLSATGFGMDYAHTLQRWRHQFNESWPRIASLGFDETFRRTWELYLSYSEAGFRSGYLDVHQLLLRHGRGQ
ncbi:MAG: methyltransferase domain-containing protein [Corynebacteriales bacterium]|nr:methyltransferase domain-containing protein [Mycobacteriales bacterium]